MASSPIQLLVFRFGTDAGFDQRATSAGLERLDLGPSIRVLDTLFAGGDAPSDTGFALRELAGAVAPGDTVGAVLVEHVWTRALDDEVARRGGATVLSRAVDAMTVADALARTVSPDPGDASTADPLDGQVPIELEDGMEEHELGPIDIVAIAYPRGAPMTGEAAPMLLELAQRGTIRILDVLFVAKGEDGAYVGFEAKDLDDKHVGEFKVFEGASSGMLGESDVAEAADALEPGEAAALIVYENRWAAPFAAAVRRNGGVLIAHQRVSIEEAAEALGATV